MKILVVGSGGREHALCWAVARSPLCDKLYCAPGNAGIAAVAECVDISGNKIDAITDFATANAIDFVIVGPEEPLVLGLADKLRAAGIPTFGPSAAAAALEGSKGFMKDAVARFGVPTAAYGRFTDRDAARAFVAKQGAPIVVKTDGLAAGKGVTICQNVDEAFTAIDEAMVGRRFGDAGAELVIEEFLDGEEASFFAICDGTNAVALAGAQDHKRAFDGDQGPNTGGMGTYSPAPVLTPAIEAEIMDTMILPTVRGMAAEGKPFVGVLFAGIMVVNGPDGKSVPKLLEYNVRFGDPECQVLMRRLKSDLVELLLAAAQGDVFGQQPQWHDEAALCVVMAAEGYPGDYQKGTRIGNLAAAGQVPGVEIFHAGTKPGPDGAVLANGGRVLGVTAGAARIAEARELAYRAVDLIDWKEGFCRRDIAWRAIARGL
ncbi:MULTISPECIES: phosphoribosylamine--glycine ligase [unclassified Azospirillum]|uniref:phosphoribosylamine--glycine ligase n=1 Tax=unclassified Azospirillum TaxID=2630922 RepID=UPI000B71E4E1|nr:MULTISPECIES: phosphoribosylamine--glycine ligase [unclassified Azospirillum]SNT23921.1 phosphoribosylamine--glycine ligase [Azospirillum sp. RU38E]SNT34839.1 phosphoribosylamine--glycine ligase [Azospirillum sp. RU37A]